MKTLKIKQYLYIVLSMILYIIIISDSILDYLNTDIYDLILFTESFLVALFSVLISYIDSKKANILSLATILAFIADYFLILDDTKAYIGILLFICVQVCYQFYLTNKLKYNLLQIIFGIFSILITYLLIKNNNNFDTLESILAIGYIIMSIFNFISCITFNNKYKKSFIILSIFCLLLCDLFIGIYQIFDIYFISKLEWIFYVPSQIFIFMQIIEDDKKYLSENIYE